MLKWKILFLAYWVPRPLLQRLNHRTWLPILEVHLCGVTAQGAKCHTAAGTPKKKEAKLKPIVFGNHSLQEFSFNSMVVSCRLFKELEAKTVSQLSRDTFLHW